MSTTPTYPPSPPPVTHTASLPPATGTADTGADLGPFATLGLSCAVLGVVALAVARKRAKLFDEVVR